MVRGLPNDHVRNFKRAYLYNFYKVNCLLEKQQTMQIKINDTLVKYHELIASR